MKRVALTSEQVWKLADVPPTTLNYWVSKGLCGPSLLASMGKRFVRYWSVQDVVAVKAVKALRDAGCSLQRVSLVQELLQKHWGVALGSSVLYWDGRKDVLRIDDSGAIISVIAETGQQLTNEVVHMMTFPLRAWIEQAVAEAGEFDLEQITDARAKRVRGSVGREADQRKEACLVFEDAFRDAETA